MTPPVELTDVDPQETREWLDALDAVVAVEGRPRAHYLIDRLLDRDEARHGDPYGRVTTAYVNTIPLALQPTYPGDLSLERRINAFIRWNAMVMVLRAGKHSGVGGHIATYASAAVLYDVGFDHFFRGRTDTFEGDLVYIQGHSAPGIYGRAYLEGRINEDQLDHFRREAGRDGLSSYPHPRLMPAFWQFPTVSMGLGPLTAAYQARFMRYLEYRDLKPHQDRRVWAFLGDGEMDQPESLAAIALGGRERLDNLVFVVNCNLQRLDGPVRGNFAARRAALGGYIPSRVAQGTPLAIPALDAFAAQLKDSGERSASTTMAFVRILGTLLKDPGLSRVVVPIVPDESRTFGMEGMFRQIGIHSYLGQRYTPQDAGQLSYYKEAQDGQILQEGINESGAMSSWIAAATSYSNHGVTTIPFYIFYSMFGMQRVGDLAWAAGDARARGFLLGATSGRTTLMGEGLQHDDGHSHVLSSVIPTCLSYDPTFAYELAVIIHDGMRRMYVEQEDIYYYITLLNENYPHPGLVEGMQHGILKGMYVLKEVRAGGTDDDGPSSQAGEVNGRALPSRPCVQLMGSGAILREVIAAADLLRDDFGVDSDVWSGTSLTEVRRDGMTTERWNLLNPDAEPRVPYAEACLAGRAGPLVVATDYMKIVADQIRPFVGQRRFVALGTDGYGRSDTRESLRTFFEVDRQFIVLAALKALADEGTISRKRVGEAIKRYEIDPGKPDPAAL
ncbi:hypothetical protein RBI14_19600 [Alcaligenaceae bacterium B3P038]|nr:hypothetical protein [Alcaligenaceae bacterium B3P038]